MMILRYFAGVMVWVTIVTVNLALLGCTLYAYNMSGKLSQAGQWGASLAAQLPMGSDPTGAQAADFVTKQRCRLQQTALRLDTGHSGIACCRVGDRPAVLQSRACQMTACLG